MTRHLMHYINQTLTLAVLASASFLTAGLGCSNSPNAPAGGGGTGGPTDDANTPTNNASGYNGSLSGKVSDQQSTRASTMDPSAAQEVPPDIDTPNTGVEFLDLDGGRLLDENGAPIPAVPLNPDGSFTAEGLPVGVDFTICVDIGNDGSCDVQGSVKIPNDDPNDPGTGRVDGAQIDPLTTVVLAKLHALLDERGIDAADLPVSPVALVTRIVDAYIHLFEESGIDAQIALQDISNLSDEQLAALFDEMIPSLAQSGMLAFRGNLGLVNSTDVQAAALAVAEVFLQAGFPIADGPDLLDLSSLSALPNIEITTPSELFRQGDPFTEDFSAVNDEIPVAQALFEGGREPTVYVNTVAEPNRNFSDEEEGAQDAPGPHLPMINDFLLLEMARLQLEGRHVTLSELRDLLTNLEDGIGARLTYFVFNPTVFGPPATVFETQDGAGKPVRIEELFGRMAADGFQGMTPEDFERRDAELRSMLQELLSGTVQPSLETMAGAFMADRVGAIDELAAMIREARVHLPFSRTGPSAFFVVADGDPFRSDATVSPVTVDADVSVNGTVSSVVYNASGTGKYYLMFTEGTEGEGIVGLMVREAGRMLHGPSGPVRLNMHDEAIFASVNGLPFIDFVSDSGNFFPGVNVSVVNSSFVPAPEDPNMPAPTAEGPSGPNQQLFVLASAPGPGAEPIHVEYDTATGVATYNPAGRFLLQFMPETQDTGMFMLFNESTGRPAGQEDPANFFAALPPPPPDGMFPPPDGMLPPPDGTLPPPGGMFPPPDGTLPPPDGTLPPPDGMFPPPDGTIPPPDNSVPPSNGETPPGQDVPEDSGIPTEEVVVETTDPLSVTDPTVIDAQPPVGDGTTGGEPISGPMPPPSLILVSMDNIVGLPIARQEFTHVFGAEAPNPRYNAEGDPYFDDINGNGVQDSDEPTSPFRPTLFKADDWRSTDIRMYYRRADNNGSVTFEEVAFDSQTPQTRDGVALVSRNFLPRLNAFRFGRPNSALNLLTAFLPPEFFDGTHALSGDTAFDVYGAIAVINLMMDQEHNVQAIVDVDGPGPQPSQSMVIDAHLFVPPIGDPFMLLLKGFAARSQALDPVNN